MPASLIAPSKTLLESGYVISYLLGKKQVTFQVISEYKLQAETQQMNCRV